LYLDAFLSPCGGGTNDESIEAIIPMDLDMISSEVDASRERVPFAEPHEWCRILL
jgi:hypothetical protein